VLLPRSDGDSDGKAAEDQPQ